jgi:KaiC/GvpD/RAD55 family RecA-like ATPase
MKDSGIRELDKHPYKSLNTIKGNFIPTGIPTLDYAINDLMPGRTTLIVGPTNEGKTTFTKQIIVNAVNLNNKVFVMSGEGDQEKLINELYQIVIGNNPNLYTVVKLNKRYHKEPTQHALESLQAWHHGKLNLFSKGKSKVKDIDEIFNLIEKEEIEEKYNLIIIDNLMSMLTAKAIEKNEMQAEFMQKCHELSEKYSIHIILILHPNKTYSKGMEIEIVHISGSGDLGNKADNIIAITRENDELIRSNNIHGKLRVIKNRDYPDKPTIDLYFDRETIQLMETNGGVIKRYHFNLDNHISIDKTIDTPNPFDL